MSLMFCVSTVYINKNILREIRVFVYFWIYYCSIKYYVEGNKKNVFSVTHSLATLVVKTSASAHYVKSHKITGQASGFRASSLHQTSNGGNCDLGDFVHAVAVTGCKGCSSPCTSLDFTDIVAKSKNQNPVSLLEEKFCKWETSDVNGQTCLSWLEGYVFLHVLNYTVSLCPL